MPRSYYQVIATKLLHKILELVHERFYVAYEARKPDEEHKSPKKRSGKKHDAPVDYDVRVSFPCAGC